jgi:hypothetical protein
MWLPPLITFATQMLASCDFYASEQHNVLLKYYSPWSIYNLLARAPEI